MKSFPWDSLIIGKNEEYGYPIIDRPSSAEELREVYKTFFSNGVFMNDSDAFQVTAGDGMNVIVAAGKCGIEGTIGYEKSPRGLAVQSSSSTADRIDTVVLRWNANVEMRNIDLYVKTGIAQEVPVRPTLTRSETVWELGIADIFVAKGTGAISQARITDTRLQTERCGAVTPFATIDTTTFYEQIQAAIDERTAELEEQTKKAVELAQSAIDGTTAGNLQKQIDENKASIEQNAQDISQFGTYRDNDIDIVRRGSTGWLRIIRKVTAGSWAETTIGMIPAEYKPAAHTQGLLTFRNGTSNLEPCNVHIYDDGTVKINPFSTAMSNVDPYGSVPYPIE